MHFLPLKENRSKEVTMVQYLQLVFKHDLASGWRHTVEKVRPLFKKTPEDNQEEKIEENDWRDKAGKNWYY